MQFCSQRYPLSPSSPPSEDESSYQGSIPGSGPSDRSYNGGGGNTGGGGAAGKGFSAPGAMSLSEGSRDSRSSGAGGAGGGVGAGTGTGSGTDPLEEAVLRPGFYMPEYKH